MSDSKVACVKWFNPKSGYGFITDVDSKADIFVHHSELKTSNNVYRTLTTGEYIEYTGGEDSTGKVIATNVTGIGGGLLLCETTANSIEERRARFKGRNPEREEPSSERR